MRKAIILAVLVMFFAGYAISVARMENLRANGADVLLSLAPVDPRALLLGDYMELEYTVNRAIWSAHATAVRETDAHGAGGGDGSEGRAVVRLSPERREADFVRLDDGLPLAADEVFLAYKVRGREVVTAATAFYFQEGHAAAYERARFGRIKVDGDGTTLLMALCDESGVDIAPEKEQ